MVNNYQELLHPEVLQTVKGLQLIARITVDGYLSGLNRSRSVGAGLEFSQYRTYEPGDDLRLLDWKMLARSSRYYIKQSDIDTNISVKFILDASRSMAYTEGEVSKINYARYTVATLAYLAQHQGDAIGLFALNDQQLSDLNPRNSHRHFTRFLNQLVNIQPQGAWPERSAEIGSLHHRNGKELLVVLSDMYEKSNELQSFVSSLKTSLNEVILLHLMGHKETQLDFNGAVTFQDLESKKTMQVNVANVREQYLADMNTYIDDLKNLLLEKGISYHQFLINEPLRDTLHTFLKNRAKLL